MSIPSHGQTVTRRITISDQHAQQVASAGSTKVVTVATGAAVGCNTTPRPTRSSAAPRWGRRFRWCGDVEEARPIPTKRAEFVGLDTPVAP